jgi:sugar O-acyltransferase (sialic acid O-acetyltransferase NeuD family)
MHPVRLPQTNPNDTRATIIGWPQADGSKVSEGQPVCSVETTKASFDVDAPKSGYLRFIAEVGSEVMVGEIIAYITETADQEFPTSDVSLEPESDANDSTRKPTLKAKLLAEKHSISLDDIPGSGQISVADVQLVISSKLGPSRDSLPAEFEESMISPSAALRSSKSRLLILGGGNGAIQILDVLATQGIDMEAVGILDDRQELHGTNILGVPVIGSLDSLESKWNEGDFDSVITSITSNIRVRRELFERAQKNNIPFENVVDPAVKIGIGAMLGQGNLIMAGCILGPFSEIGDNNFFSTVTVVSHHCKFGSHITTGPGVYFSGGVNVGDEVKFGTSIGVEPNLTIGDRAIIASGLAVTSNIDDDKILRGTIGRIGPA